MAFVSPEPNTGCWLWMGSTFKDGYGSFKIKGRTVRAHRAGWLLFRGTIPPGKQVLHHCDNPLCVNFDRDLFLGTNLENVEDRCAKGRGRGGGAITLGEENGASRLTVEKVRYIRQHCVVQHGGPQVRGVTDPTSALSIARELGVTVRAVLNVVYRKAWKHVS